MFLVVIAVMIQLTIIRHEGSHALVAWLEGASVLEVRLIPGLHPELGFYFGYVARNGGSWITDAAPWLAALLWFAAGWWLLHKWQPKTRWFTPLFLWLLISPTVDLAYNYLGGFVREGSDVSDLFLALPDGWVHLAYWGALIICIWGIVTIRRRRPE